MARQVDATRIAALLCDVATQPLEAQLDIVTAIGELRIGNQAIAHGDEHCAVGENILTHEAERARRSTAKPAAVQENEYRNGCPGFWVVDIEHLLRVRAIGDVQL